MVKKNPEKGNELTKNLTSAKWYLWYGNVEKVLVYLEECYLICGDEDIQYNNQKKLLEYLEELNTHVKNNSVMIPNYGEKHRYGEAIASSFVESTVNEEVTKRMVKNSRCNGHKKRLIICYKQEWLR